MGLLTNYPFALAAGLGINAVVAFGLVLGLGMTAAQAMGVIVIEGVIITILVCRLPRGDHERGTARPEAGHRRRHRPVHPVHRLVDGGLIVGVTPEFAPPPPPLAFQYPTDIADAVFLVGIFLTFALWALKVRGALIISIALTTVLAMSPGSGHPGHVHDDRRVSAPWVSASRTFPGSSRSRRGPWPPCWHLHDHAQ